MEETLGAVRLRREGLALYGAGGKALLDGYAHLQALRESLPEACELRIPREGSGRRLDGMRIPAKAWFIVIKAFELGLDGRRTAQLADLSLPTAYRAFTTLREALAGEEGRRRRTGLFGVRAEAGLVRVSELSPDQIRQDEEARIVHRDGFVCTSPHWGYDALVWHLQETGGLPAAVKAGRKAPRTPFVNFLIGQSLKHRGIRLETFPLYLKEYEFRYNHRGRPLFDLLIKALLSRRATSSPAPGRPTPCP